MRNIAIILAGGMGSRMGCGMPKQLLPLADGQTILEHSVAAFEQAECIDEIGIVMHPAYIARAEEMLLRNGWQKVAFITGGGKERRESSMRAIEQVNAELRMKNDECADTPSHQPINSFNRLNHASTNQPINPSTSSTTHQPINLSTNQPTTNILLHDAARPFVSQRIISDVCKALTQHEAVTVAIPATDTMYMVGEYSNGAAQAGADVTMGRSAGELFVQDIPLRSTLMCAQTPQAFRLDVIARAYALAQQDPNWQSTDDCGVVRRYLPDTPIYIVPGDSANRKITYREDMEGKQI